MDTINKLCTTTVTLHWIVAILIIGLLATGIYMEENEVRALYPWHKSFGVLVAFFVLLRVVWRIRTGWPPAANQYKRAEQILSKIVHYVLIIGTVLMPLSGIMMSALGGHGLAFFGLELVAQNPDPANPDKVLPLNATLAQAGHTAHGLGGNIMIGAIALHVIGALKHHVIDRDGTLRRILGATV